MNDRFLMIVVSFLVIYPLINLTYTLGLAFFGVVFGGKVDKIILGTGKKIFSLGVFQLRNNILGGGECFVTRVKINRTSAKILFALGGIIFNLIEGCIVLILVLCGVVPLNIITINIIILTLYMLLSNSIPFIPVGGADNSGKRVMNIIKFSRLDKLAQNDKTLSQFIIEVDKEIDRLKKVCSISQFDNSKLSYFNMLKYKAITLEKLGQLEEVHMAWKSLDVKLISNMPNLLINYYNDVLYNNIETGRLDSLDEVYKSLVELLEKDEYRKYLSVAVKDTLAIYEYYRGSKEKSEMLFKEILEAEGYNSTFSSSLYYLSLIYFERGQLEAAEKTLNHIDFQSIGMSIREKAEALKARIKGSIEQ